MLCAEPFSYSFSQTEKTADKIVFPFTCCSDANHFPQRKYGADVLSCSDNPSGEACKRGLMLPH